MQGGLRTGNFEGSGSFWANFHVQVYTIDLGTQKTIFRLASIIMVFLFYEDMESEGDF